MKFTAHVTPLNGVPRRIEVEAHSREEAIRAALSGYPRHTRASARITDQTAIVQAGLALRMSHFPLVVAP